MATKLASLAVLIGTVSILSIGPGCVATSDGGPDEDTNGTEDAVTKCANGPTVKGIDVSYYQGKIDWNAVKAGGYQFAFARVSDGANFIDPDFPTYWAGMKAAGVIRGTYQFFRPQQDGTTQANVLLSHVKLEPGDLPPVLDVEVTDGASSATIVSRIRQWVARIKQATGMTPIIYTAPGFWAGISGASEFGEETLWVANWQVSCPGVPSAWSNWTFWQYADNGAVPGIPAGGVDHDEFNGSLADLQAFANGGGGKGPIPTTHFADGGQWVKGLAKPDWAAVGDFNGDGKDDLAWYTTASGAITIELSTGSGFKTAGQWVTGWGKPDWAAVGDFNGDGKADVAWYEAWNNHGIHIALSTGSTFAQKGHWITGVGAPDWAGVGDFNGDGKDDIAWFEDWNNHAISMITSTGSALKLSGKWITGFGKPDFAAVGDFNGDGKADVAWYEAWNNNAITIAASTGSSLQSQGKWVTGFGKPDWAAVGDLNADGQADVTWYEGWNNHAITVAESSGKSLDPNGKWLQGWGAADWAALGDFDGDGRKDVAWYEAWNNQGVHIGLSR